MNKKYQKKMPVAPDAHGLTVPEHVTVAMAEIVGDMREGLLALAVGAGLQVMSAMMDADVTTLAGVKGKHDSDRAAVRHGHERGSVTLGGRRVRVERPRVRAVHGSGELPVPAYELFSSTEILGRMAMDRMLAGLSTRRYQVGLEPVGQQVSEVATSTSRSAVSRKFVTQTETALAGLLSADADVVLLDDAKNAVLFDQLRQDRAPGSPATAPAMAAPPAAPLIVAPAAIRVRVFNGSGIPGLGRKAATALATLGFTISGAASSRGTGGTQTTISYGPTRADSARTLAAALPGSSLAPDPTLGRTLQVVIGSSYTSAHPVTISSAPATPAAAAASSAPKPAVSAADTTCAP